MSEELLKVAPLPVLLRGGTGWGKSVLARHLSETLERPYSGINAHPGMDMAQIVGMWRPMPTEHGVTVVWEDGVLTRAIRNGHVFLFEELTRAPQEATSRLFGLLDHGFRYWPLPEAGEDGIPVHPDFWFVATANPVGTGYQTSKLDKALESRFAAIYDVDTTMAQERTLVNKLVGNDMERRVEKFVADVRGEGHKAIASLPTRDLVLMCTLMQRGISAERSVAISVAPKHPEEASALVTAAQLHFGVAE
jgi:MoxR-like ATPase